MAENDPLPTDAPQPRPRPRALGRGLETLLPPQPPVPVRGYPIPVQVPDGEESPTRWLEVNLIDNNPMQTRMSVNDAALEELKQSISENGLLQPILVRPTANGRYHVVGGQRRLSAVRQLGLLKIQAYIKPSSDEEAFLHTVLENLQREDLNPIEQAHAFSRLVNQFRYSQDDIARKTGKSRSAVTNFLRLLKLPQDLQAALIQGHISNGHAKALLMLNNPETMSAIGYRVVTNELSVRKTEEIVRHYLYGKPQPEEKPRPELEPNARAAQEALQRALGLKVNLEYNEGKGRVIIHYRNIDDFQVLIDALGIKDI